MTGFIKKKPAEVIRLPVVTPAPKPVVAPPQPLPGGPLFDVAVRYVMENEDGVSYDHDKGTFTNNPKDPGGATMWGIIKTEYESFAGHDLTIDDVKAMPRETALAIYRKNFWEQIHGDSYAYQACATAIMDTAVNKGLGGCMVILTDALHQHFEVRYGTPLVSAVNALSPAQFLQGFESATERYIQARIERFPNMDWARAGWTNRARRLLTLS